MKQGTKLEVAILAGGGSRRMGCDKSLLPLGGRPLVLHVIEALAGLGSRARIITANPELGRIAGLPLQGDLIAGRGPLSGIHAALATAIEPWVFVAACDLPFLEAALVRGLADRCTDRLDAVVPCPGGAPVPVAALYRSTSARTCEEMLAEGKLAARALIDRLSVRGVDDGELSRLGLSDRCFLNVNTPEDHRRAEELL